MVDVIDMNVKHRAWLLMDGLTLSGARLFASRKKVNRKKPTLSSSGDHSLRLEPLAFRCL